MELTYPLETGGIREIEKRTLLGLHYIESFNSGVTADVSFFPTIRAGVDFQPTVKAQYTFSPRNA